MGSGMSGNIPAHDIPARAPACAPSGVEVAPIEELLETVEQLGDESAARTTASDAADLCGEYLVGHVCLLLLSTQAFEPPCGRLLGIHRYNIGIHLYNIGHRP